MKETYLKAPTLKELLYVGGILYFEPEEAYQKVKNMAKLIPTLNKEFTLPDELKSKPLNKLENILKSIKYKRTPLLNGEELRNENNGVLYFIKITNLYNKAYEMLFPQNIWNQKLSDCKGLAILSVSFLRKKGISSRIRLYSPEHVIFEKYENGIWQPKEPQNLRTTNLKPMPIKENFSKYYEFILQD